MLSLHLEALCVERRPACLEESRVHVEAHSRLAADLLYFLLAAQPLLLIFLLRHQLCLFGQKEGPGSCRSRPDLLPDNAPHVLARSLPVGKDGLTGRVRSARAL